MAAMSWSPSQPLFINRLAHLVERDTQEGVAGYYNVSTETVRRWLRGRQQPSARTKRSVASRGQVITGPSMVVRNEETGLFETQVVSGQAAKAVRTVNRRRRERAQALREAATNDRQRALADLEGEPLTREEVEDLDRRHRELTRRSALGEQTDELNSDWTRWRSDYRTLGSGAGTQPMDEEVVSRPRRPRRKVPNLYVIVGGKRREAFIGPRGGFFYREPSGRAVYVRRERLLGRGSRRL